ncbi:hypothetical protein Pmar_PMAR015006, partial [Perkinsus marinus ATCC 50983]
IETSPNENQLPLERQSSTLLAESKSLSGQGREGRLILRSPPPPLPPQATTTTTMMPTTTIPTTLLILPTLAPQTFREAQTTASSMPLTRVVRRLPSTTPTRLMGTLLML